MSSTGWIYKNNNDNTMRYVLGTNGEKTLFCFGINPSTAEPNSLDPTLRKVKRISESNGYDSWVMFNVYPKRDTHFEDLSKICNDFEHCENKKIIKDEFENIDMADVWVAFGDHIYDRAYLLECWKDIYNEIKHVKINWFATGVNKSGSPKHPLYQKDSAILEQFNMASFINNL